MTNILRKYQWGVIAQFFSPNVQTPKLYIPPYLQQALENHSKVFDNIHIGLPPTQDHDNAIQLVPGNVPPNIRPYRYPYAKKIEIEHMVVEMLEAGIIQPS